VNKSIPGTRKSSFRKRTGLPTGLSGLRINALNCYLHVVLRVMEAQWEALSINQYAGNFACQLLESVSSISLQETKGTEGNGLVT
jgi:hypothetical protein